MRGRRTVLHLDDDPTILRLVAKYLESNANCEVVACSDPDGLAEHLRTSSARVVLLDVDLPGKSGLQLLQEIKAHDGGIQVIMLTGVASLATVLDSMRSGAVACVFKRLDDFSKLDRALETAFRNVAYWLELIDSVKQQRDLAELDYHTGYMAYGDSHGGAI